jgi:hypothetical protein
MRSNVGLGDGREKKKRRGERREMGRENREWTDGSVWGIGEGVPVSVDAIFVGEELMTGRCGGGLGRLPQQKLALRYAGLYLRGGNAPNPPFAVIVV